MRFYKIKVVRVSAYPNHTESGDDKMKKRLVTLCTATLLTLWAVLPIGNQVNKEIKDLFKFETKQLDPEEKVELLFPIKGETVDILKPAVSNYIAAMHQQASAIQDDQLLHDFYVMAPDTDNRYYGETFTNDTDKVRISDFANTSIYQQRSKKVMLTFIADGHTPDKVKVSENADMSNAVELAGLDYSSLAYFVGVDQLKSGKTYYWQVFEKDVAISEVASFKTQEGFRMITTNSVTNVRDMGGRIVKLKQGDGYITKRIKQGLVFRGGELVKDTYTPESGGTAHTATLQTGDAEFFVKDLGIGLEIDLRGDEESGNLVESPLKTYYSEKYSENVDVNYLRLANLSAYDDFFSISSSKPYYSDIKNMFKAFANAQDRHVYFHCWGGADRTGTVGFLLGGLLGMSLTDLIIDYELTSFSCNYRPHETNDAKKVYRFPSLLKRVMNATVKGDSKTTYWAADKPISQIIEEVLIDRFEVTQEDIYNIRNNLLEDYGG